MSGILVFVFKDREFRSSPDHIVGGVVVGLVIVGGWYVPGHIGYAENPETLRTPFSAPTAATSSRSRSRLPWVTRARPSR